MCYYLVYYISFFSKYFGNLDVLEQYLAKAPGAKGC